MNQAAPYPSIPHEFIVVLVYTLLAITGLIGNCWVMMTVISQLVGCRYAGNRHRGTVSVGVQHSACMYLLLLSVVDLISFVPVPLLAADIVANRWPFGIGLCKLLWSCEGANKSLSPLVLTALSVDRYIAVCRPSFLWLRQKSFACLVISVCIFISSLFILPVTFKATIGIMEDSNKEEHLKCILGMSRTYDVFHILICYMLPLSLICSVYVAILKRLYQHTRMSTVGRRTSISLSRVVKCSVLVVAFYFICWTPYIWMFRIGAIFSGVTDQQLSTNQEDGGSPSSTFNPVPLLSHNFTSIYQKIHRIMTVANNTRQPPLMHKNLSSSDLSLLLSIWLTGKGDVVSKDSILLDAGHLEDQRFRNEQAPPNILLMYLLHALPYTQSAFNWLFYAFLNRNLRQSNRCPGMSTRSMQVTSTPFEGNGHTATTNGINGQPLSWKNVGSYLKSASIDMASTGHSVIRKSPFRSRSRIRSKSTTCLETSSLYNGGSTIISLINQSTIAANGLLTAPADNNHFLTSFSLADTNRAEKIRLVAPNGAGGRLLRPSWPNGLTSHNHYNGTAAAAVEKPSTVCLGLLTAGEAVSVLSQSPQPSSLSSFTSLGLSFEPIVEDDCHEKEETLISERVSLLEATANSSMMVNGDDLTHLHLEGPSKANCFPDNKSEGSDVEWL